MLSKCCFANIEFILYSQKWKDKEIKRQVGGRGSGGESLHLGVLGFVMIERQEPFDPLCSEIYNNIIIF